MSKVALVFSHQLFKHADTLKHIETVYLVENKLYFSQHKFHQQKNVFHRASYFSCDSAKLVRTIRKEKIVLRKKNFIVLQRIVNNEKIIIYLLWEYTE